MSGNKITCKDNYVYFNDTVSSVFGAYIDEYRFNINNNIVELYTDNRWRKLKFNIDFLISDANYVKQIKRTIKIQQYKNNER